MRSGGSSVIAHLELKVFFTIYHCRGPRVYYSGAVFCHC